MKCVCIYHPKTNLGEISSTQKLKSPKGVFVWDFGKITPAWGTSIFFFICVYF